MEITNNSFPWLELIDHPVFCVKGGIIVAANTSAENRLLHIGTDIRQIVTENREAYDAFGGGSLYLNITVCGMPCPASVTRTPECDIFHILQGSEDGTLQALALAAMQLRVPLANIMTVTDRLFSNLKNTDEEVQKQASQINQNLYRLLRIISNMSDTDSYLNASATGMQTTDLSAVFDEIIEKAQTIFANTGSCLKYSGLNTSVFSLVNREKLERAIYNMLSNAAKFSPSGSTVTAALTKSGNRLTFTVCNTATEDLPEQILWQRYQREPAVEDPRHGLGLGMTLINAVAALHGGTVLVDRPSIGETRVTMTIPIVKETSDTVRSPILPIGDYAGGRDKGLLELSEILSADAFENIN